jgi:hypothetical protein
MSGYQHCDCCDKPRMADAQTVEPLAAFSKWRDAHPNQTLQETIDSFHHGQVIDAWAAAALMVVRDLLEQGLPPSTRLREITT